MKREPFAVSSEFACDACNEDFETEAMRNDHNVIVHGEEEAAITPTAKTPAAAKTPTVNSPTAAKTPAVNSPAAANRRKSGPPATPKKFNCPVDTCDAVMSSQSEINEHLLGKHTKMGTPSDGTPIPPPPTAAAKKEKPPLACGDCPKTFQSPARLSTHRKKVHGQTTTATTPPGNRMAKCPRADCGMRYSSKANLEKHVAECGGGGGAGK